MMRFVALKTEAQRDVHVLHRVRDRLVGQRTSFMNQIRSILLERGIVVPDNLCSHKGPRVREMIEKAGANLRYLSPCSPDFNPIKKDFANLRALLRKAAERTVEGFWTAIGRLLNAFTPSECANYLAAAGYDAT